ncbi:Transposon Tf2-7 polyprotein [Rhizoctonia solani]|uniref:Transposon Tf2-7 polyprotein n=1 Tax=Rhizoctonia solani TaxID=456999 RepID=A0A0K6G3D6_9AGAM|nr:Transposon Tf2-7 polyprotein [Rhizoctonia solani]
MSVPTFNTFNISIPDPHDVNSLVDVVKTLRDIAIEINKNTQALHQAVSTLENNDTTIEGRADSIEAAANNLEKVVIKLQSDVSSIATGTVPAGSSGKKLKLKEPSKFDGSNKNKAVPFRVAITHYMHITDPLASTDAQIAYIVAWLADVTLFWTEFNTRWNVHNKKEGNRTKLRALHQTSGVQDYYKDFQTYSQGLGYNDNSLRDQFYDGLTIKIKEMMVSQNYDHSAATYEQLATKALEIDSRLEAFKAQQKQASSSSSGKTDSKEKSKLSAATPGAPGNKLTVGDHVYVLRDGKAVKGKITKVGKGAKGKDVPTVLWNDGTTTTAKFKTLRLDSYPTEGVAPPPSAPPKASGSGSSSGPQPMDLDAAGNGSHKEEIVCNVAEIGKQDIVLGMSWLKKHNPDVDWPNKRVCFNSSFCSQNCISINNVILGNVGGHNRLEGIPEDLEGSEVFEPLGEAPQETGDIGGVENHLKDIPEFIADFSDIFAEDNSVTDLPPHRSYDLEIKLLDKNKTVKGPVYPLKPSDDEELRRILKEQLDKGLIRPSKSRYSSPVIFVNKKNGKRRMVVDYRALNDNTVKNAYPLPLISTLVEKLRGSKVFSTLDLKFGYNLVRIKEEDVWKTAFKTKYGLFETRVMPFGLCNAPACFQYFMNDIFMDILDVFVIVYLDDILIFSKNEEDHEKHVREVLSRLRKAQCLLNLEKCKCKVPEVHYLGVIANGEGVKVDPAKVTKAVDWPTPKTVKNIQEFIGFVNFYRRFIEDFNEIARPLYNLIGKNYAWRWTEIEEKAFNDLKQALVNAPCLMQPDVSKEFLLECDASDFATGAVLNQIGSDEKMHPVAFLSKTLSPAERNYNIYDKELLAVIRALKEWRHLLEGSAIPIKILTDHKNLETFSKKKELNRRQMRWMGILADYNYRIVYRKGVENKKADILSRRDELREQAALEGGETPVLIDPSFFISAILTDVELKDLIRDALPDDKSIQKILKSLEEEIPVKGWQLDSGLLYYHD